jgi:hypothetical protein
MACALHLHRFRPVRTLGSRPAPFRGEPASRTRPRRRRLPRPNFSSTGTPAATHQKAGSVDGRAVDWQSGEAGVDPPGRRRLPVLLQRKDMRSGRWLGQARRSSPTKNKHERMHQVHPRCPRPRASPAAIQGATSIPRWLTVDSAWNRSADSGFWEPNVEQTSRRSCRGRWSGRRQAGRAPWPDVRRSVQRAWARCRGRPALPELPEGNSPVTKKVCIRSTRGASVTTIRSCWQPGSPAISTINLRLR